MSDHASPTRAVPKLAVLLDQSFGQVVAPGASSTMNPNGLRTSGTVKLREGIPHYSLRDLSDDGLGAVLMFVSVATSTIDCDFLRQLSVIAFTTLVNPCFRFHCPN
jgi:hypothetical protein